MALNKDKAKNPRSLNLGAPNPAALNPGRLNLRSMLGKVKSVLDSIEGGLHEFYVTPYRRSFARAQRDEEDLFMLLVFAETMGVPNPAAFYTMELLPVVYDRFHDWHVRMGMEKSPLDHISCC